jgi:putative spermidine/putrescine transport system permease protein
MSGVQASTLGNSGANPGANPTSILPQRGGMLGRLSDLFWRRPGLLLFLMLTPPLLWLGIIYIGSLIALLLQSFFSVDDFSGLIDYNLTLATYAQLLNSANLDIIIRTVLMAALVTVASAFVAVPIA